MEFDREDAIKAFDVETAITILNEARAGGYEDQPQPENEEDLIRRAVFFYETALEAFHVEGMKNNTVQSIIFWGDAQMAGRGASTLPRKSSGGFSESDKREADGFPKDGQVIHRKDEIFASENLPIPQHIEGDPTPMSRDFTATSDKEIRRLSGEYNAFLARVTYLLGIESSDLAGAEHLLEAAKAKAVRSIDLKDPNDPKKSKLAKVIEAEILADTEVSDLSDKVSKHQQTVIVLKSLKEIYTGNVDRLSREWTMRQNEWEKSK